AIGSSGGAPIASVFVREVRIGTTAATNALLTRRGERCALLVTKGFADLLTIGTQDRPSLFALHVVKTPPLATDMFEIDERVLADGTVRAPIDFHAVREIGRQIVDRGVRSAAVLFLHAYAHPDHERIAGMALQAAGVE